jgi:Leucine-rich repeat (LRR) protein
MLNLKVSASQSQQKDSITEPQPPDASNSSMEIVSGDQGATPPQAGNVDQEKIADPQPQIPTAAATRNTLESPDVNLQTEKRTAGSSDSTSPQTKARRVCEALTNGGHPCRAAATEGGLCFFHGNPQKASELGRIGGRKKYRTVTELNPLPKLDSARGICGSIAQLAEEVHSGKIDPKVAASLTQLARLLLHALPAADVEKERSNMRLPDDFCTPTISTQHKKEEISNVEKSKEA